LDVKNTAPSDGAYRKAFLSNFSVFYKPRPSIPRRARRRCSGPHS